MTTYTLVGMVNLTSLLVLSLSTGPASAIDFSQYEKVRKTEIFKQHIFAVGTGYFWANAELDRKKQSLLYCQTKKVALNAENYLQILNNYMEAEQRAGMDFAPFPLEAILLVALQEAFPCE